MGAKKIDLDLENSNQQGIIDSNQNKKNKTKSKPRHIVQNFNHNFFDGKNSIENNEQMNLPQTNEKTDFNDNIIDDDKKFIENMNINQKNDNENNIENKEFFISEQIGLSNQVS